MRYDSVEAKTRIKKDNPLLQAANNQQVQELQVQVLKTVETQKQFALRSHLHSEFDHICIQSFR